MREKGQVVLILILVMTVALGIGVSVVQRSLSDVSTASKVEQSSRAFSAAEAGIEKAIQSSTGFTTAIPLGNNSSIQEVQASPIPASGQALEYPPLAKEEMAQVWLANPDDLSSPYGGSTLDIYWGNSTTDRAALELTLVYYGTEYSSKKFYLDQITRTPANNFDTTADCSTAHTIGTNTYQCKYTITSIPSSPRLLRARLLYNTTSQPFAVSPVGTCGASPCSLPSQAHLFTATGTSGQTQRKVQVFRLDKVVPSFFDYAIFSAGSINK